MVDARGPLQVGDDRQMEMERCGAAHGRASWAVLGSEEPDRMALSTCLRSFWDGGSRAIKLAVGLGWQPAWSTRCMLCLCVASV